jgi:hypothetical protein
MQRRTSNRYDIEISAIVRGAPELNVAKFDSLRMEPLRATPGAPDSSPLAVGNAQFVADGAKYNCHLFPNPARCWFIGRTAPVCDGSAGRSSSSSSGFSFGVSGFVGVVTGDPFAALTNGVDLKRGDVGDHNIVDLPPERLDLAGLKAAAQRRRLAA